MNKIYCIKKKEESRGQTIYQIRLYDMGGKGGDGNGTWTITKGDPSI